MLSKSRVYFNHLFLVRKLFKLERRRILQTTDIIEGGELPVMGSLKKNDIFQDQECMVETTQDCAQTGCIYDITCVACQETIETEKTSGKESN